MIMTTATLILILELFKLLLLLAAGVVVIWLIFLSLPGWLGGAPFVPARQEWVKEAVRLAGVKPGEIVIDLGSGDGRLLVAAAAGAKVVGYEINPYLVLVSRLRLLAAGKSKSFRVVWGDYRKADLHQADVVFIYSVTGALALLDEKLRREMKPGARLISIRYPIAGRKAEVESEGVFLYEEKG